MADSPEASILQSAGQHIALYDTFPMPIRSQIKESNSGMFYIYSKSCMQHILDATLTVQLDMITFFNDTLDKDYVNMKEIIIYEYRNGSTEPSSPKSPEITTAFAQIKDGGIPYISPRDINEIFEYVAPESAKESTDVDKVLKESIKKHKVSILPLEPDENLDDILHTYAIKATTLLEKVGIHFNRFSTTTEETKAANETEAVEMVSADEFHEAEQHLSTPFTQLKTHFTTKHKTYLNKVLKQLPKLLKDNLEVGHLPEKEIVLLGTMLTELIDLKNKITNQTKSQTLSHLRKIMTVNYAIECALQLVSENSDQLMTRFMRLMNHPFEDAKEGEEVWGSGVGNAAAPAAAADSAGTPPPPATAAPAAAADSAGTPPQPATAAPGAAVAAGEGEDSVELV